jgi:hypothetical protein
MGCLMKKFIYLLFIFLSCNYSYVEQNQNALVGHCVGPDEQCEKQVKLDREECLACYASCEFSFPLDFGGLFDACITGFEDTWGSGNYSETDILICVSQMYDDTSQGNCKNNCDDSQCQGSQNSCPEITIPCMADYLFPSENDEEIYDNLIEFEIFGEDEEDEFTDLSVKLDQFEITNDNHINIINNIIAIKNITPGFHVFTFKSERHGEYSIRMNITKDENTKKKINLRLKNTINTAPLSGKINFINFSYDSIENTKIILISLSDSTVDYTVTDKYGDYEFPAVSPGSYRLITFSENFIMKEIPPFLMNDTELHDMDFIYTSLSE